MTPLNRPFPRRPDEAVTRARPDKGRARRRRRVALGTDAVVAAYVHELSARHRAGHVLTRSG